MKSKNTTRFIMVAGGVISGVGKGVITASIGKILQQHGYKTTVIKIDPYINFDAGTLRPTEHGEVWVTADGGEIDQDLGTYERFLNINIPKKNSITTGQVYKSVIDKERSGYYLGKTVQFIPHIIDEVIERIYKAAEGFDFAVIEIGGTVGDYENTPFLLALKSVERDLGPDFVSYVLVSYLPVPDHIGEMKTKPTQQSIRMLNEQSITPDFIVCRSKYKIDAERLKKIELYAHIKPEYVLSAPDLESVYQMPQLLEKQSFGKKLLQKFKLQSRKNPEWDVWETYTHNIVDAKESVTIALIGKYNQSGGFAFHDSYVSISHALMHAGAYCQKKVKIRWFNAEEFENKNNLRKLLEANGIIIPGGFGTSGIQGKINAIEYVRTHGIPYLGICYGLQLAVIEFARNVCQISDAHSAEVNPKTKNPVIDLLENQRAVIDSKHFGASMRLGEYPTHIVKNSRVYELYQAAHRITDSHTIYERHRHRYEVNPEYISLLEKNGLLFSGFFQDKSGARLMEFCELPSHPFFVATQAHPEFTSRLENPNPLFVGFINRCF